MDIYFKIVATLFGIGFVGAMISMVVSTALSYPKWMDVFVYSFMAMLGLGAVLGLFGLLGLMWLL